MKNLDLNERLEKVISYAHPALTEQDEMGMSKKPFAEKWSKKEILGHLNDSYINNARRLILSYEKNGLRFEGYNADLWVAATAYQKKSWMDVVEVWKIGQVQMVDLIVNLPEEIMMKKTTEHNFDTMLMNPIPKNKPSSMYNLIYDYIYHQEYHLNQVLDGYIFQLES